MSSWTIHLPPPDSTGVTHPERFVAIKDGVRPLAIVFGPVWFLFKRLWWGLALVLALEAILFAAGWGLSLPRPVSALLQALLHFLLGLEASTIQRWTLRRRGWREVGAVIAHGSSEAEMRAAMLIEQAAPDLSPRPAPLRNSPAASTATPAILGLFPEARTR